MLQSDRALALASTQVKLYRDEFLIAGRVGRQHRPRRRGRQALQGGAEDRPDRQGGGRRRLALIEKLKTGQGHEGRARAGQISAKADAAEGRPDGVARDGHAGHGAGRPPAARPARARPAADPAAERAAPRGGRPPAIEEQRYRVLVDATIRRARQLLRTDPDAAYQDLKRQRDEILGYDGDRRRRPHARWSPTSRP